MTVEASKTIRAALKAAGYGTKEVSVRNDSYSMGSTVHVRIKDPVVPLLLVEAIASRSERVDRDASGEILSGGNMFVQVTYEHGALDAHEALAREQLAAGRSVFGSYRLSSDPSYPGDQSAFKVGPDGVGRFAGRIDGKYGAEYLVRILAAAGELACLDAGCVTFTNADGEIVNQDAPRAAPAAAPEPLIEVKHAGTPTDRTAQVDLLARMNAAAANVEPEPMRDACAVCTVEVEVDGTCANCAAVARSQRERASRDPDSLAKRLVEQSSRSGFSTARVGRVEVTIDAGEGDVREVTVNWPAVGAQLPSDALTFAIDIMHASRVALLVERLLAAPRA
jgi:hypothetical protein